MTVIQVGSIFENVKAGPEVKGQILFVKIQETLKQDADETVILNFAAVNQFYPDYFQTYISNIAAEKGIDYLDDHILIEPDGMIKTGEKMYLDVRGQYVS